jgi:hypothetical protein
LHQRSHSKRGEISLSLSLSLSLSSLALFSQLTEKKFFSEKRIKKEDRSAVMGKRSLPSLSTECEDVMEGFLVSDLEERSIRGVFFFVEPYHSRAVLKI